jgi:hypothetical protein
MKIVAKLQFWRHIVCALCLVTVSLFTAPAGASGVLTPHSAEYKVKISVVSGRLRTELRATESGYEARHTIKPTGMSRLVARGEISEVSKFTNGDDGLIPVAYQSHDTLSRDKVRADIVFDWDTNEASGKVNDEDFVTVLEGLSHDRVSIQYELMHDLLKEGPSTEYRLFDVDKLKTIIVRTIGEKKVRVPAGKFTAIGIQHQAENSSRVTTLWCVEELDFLPVVIEQHRKGKLKVRATLKNYTPVRPKELSKHD